MNVNRALVLNADGAMDYIRSKGRVMQKLERIVKILFHHTLIISVGLPDLEFNIARMLRKRVIYIMHGCNQYENVINRLGLTENDLAREQRYLQYADKVVAVSENYAGWVKRRFPEFAHKVTFVNNGLELVDIIPPIRPTMMVNTFSPCRAATDPSKTTSRCVRP